MYFEKKNVIMTVLLLQLNHLKPFWEKEIISISLNYYREENILCYYANTNPIVVVVIKIFHFKQQKKRNILKNYKVLTKNLF